MGSHADGRWTVLPRRLGGEFFPPGVQSEPAFWDAYGRAEKAANLWLAGADYQLGYGNGYMEGAVRSGQDVARQIAARFQAAADKPAGDAA